MRAIVGALLCAISFPAFAANLSWTHPTTYSDATPLAVADIASTTIEWSNGSTFGTVAGSQVVMGTANTATAPDPAAGAAGGPGAARTV